MRGERLALPGSAEIRLPTGCQCVRVHLIGQPVFLRCVELAAQNHRSGVRGRALVGTGDVANARVIRVRVAIVAVELPAGLELIEIALRANVTALVVRASALQPEQAHVAVGREQRVVFEGRRIQPVQMHAIERAVQVFRQLARHFAVAEIDLEARRRGIAHFQMSGEIDHIDRPLVETHD